MQSTDGLSGRMNGALRGRRLGLRSVLPNVDHDPDVTRNEMSRKFVEIE